MNNQNKIDELNKQLLYSIYKDLSEKCIESYYVFFKTFWDLLNNEILVDNWHIKYLCDDLQKLSVYLVDRKEKPYDEIINIPPGTTKSSIVTIFFQSWLWLKDPTLIIITSSFNSSLAVDHSLKSQQIVLSELYTTMFSDHFIKAFGKELKFIKTTEHFWSNNYGGGRIATSTTGSIVGRHAHLIIKDDPEDGQVIHSDAYVRQSKRHDEALTSRKIDKANTPTLTIMQRLSQRDNTARQLKKSGKTIKHICLPAKLSINVKPEELKERYINGYLDPIRLNQDVLDDQKEDLGSLGYAGQYGQNPHVEGGDIIKGEWFKIVSEHDVPTRLIIDVWIDGAYTESTKNDPTGIMVTAFDRVVNRMFITHTTHKFFELPALLKFIPEYTELCGIGPMSKTFVEPKASGLSLISMLNELTPDSVIQIKGHLVGEGKTARMNTAAPKVEAGKVHLVEGSWNEFFIGQLEAFPNGEHDEFCDLIGYATDHYFKKKNEFNLQ